VFKSPNLWAIIVMYHAFCYGSFFFLSWWPTYLQQGRGFAEAEVKAYLSVPFILGAIANLAGGFASDFMVKKIGLKWGRRSVALAGLSTSALFILAATVTTSKVLVVAFMAIGFAASDFMLPTAWAVCLDIGRKYAGAVTGTMNTAGQIGSFTVSVLVGYMVKSFHSYDAPLIPIGLMMALSAAMWLKIDPTKQLVPEDEPVPAKA
jgi:predicted MFS family arabinose efflux permease